MLTVFHSADNAVIFNEDRNRWRGPRSDGGLVGEVTMPGHASAGLGRHSDSHRRAWRGPAGHRFQLRRGRGGARSRPWAKDPINAHRDGDGAEPISVAQCGAGEEVQRVPERGPLRCRPGPAAPRPRRSRRRGRRPAGTATVRAVRGRRAAISDGGLGPPEPGGDGAVSGAAGVCDQGGPDRFGAVRAADGQRGRGQVWVTWQSAPRARRGVTVTVSAPLPRTVQARPLPNGRSTPRHSGQGRAPARGFLSHFGP